MGSQRCWSLSSSHWLTRLIPDADLLVLVVEEELEDVAVGDHGVSTHPDHPTLQPLHAPLNVRHIKETSVGGGEGWHMFNMRGEEGGG